MNILIFASNLEMVINLVTISLIIMALCVYETYSYTVKENPVNLKISILLLGLIGVSVNFILFFSSINFFKTYQFLDFLIPIYFSILTLSVAFLSIVILQLSQKVFIKKIATLSDTQAILVDTNRQVKNFMVFVQNNSLMVNQRMNELSESIVTSNDLLTKEIEVSLNGALKNNFEKLQNHLKDIFKDNFINITLACEQLILWQENYKSTMDNSESVISKLNILFEKIQNSFDYMSQSQLLLNDLFKNLNDSSESYSKQVAMVNKNVRILTGQHIKIKDFIENTEISFNNVANNFIVSTDVINESIKNQVDDLHRSNRLLRNELASSLSLLDQNLSMLTDKFKENYEAYLDDNLNKIKPNNAIEGSVNNSVS